MKLLVIAIRKEREKLNLTQKEMADLSGMSIRNYRYLEERGTGSVKSFEKVLEVLGVKEITFII